MLILNFEEWEENPQNSMDHNAKEWPFQLDGVANKYWNDDWIGHFFPTSISAYQI